LFAEALQQKQLIKRWVDSDWSE